MISLAKKTKYEGISLDVVENKKTKSVTFGRPWMLQKTNGLLIAKGLSMDVDENKQLPLRSRLVSIPSIDVDEKKWVKLPISDAGQTV